MVRASVAEVYLGGSAKKEGNWVWVGRQKYPMIKESNITKDLLAERWLGGNTYFI